MQASQELDTIPAILRNNVDQSGDSIALIYESNKITYAALHELVLNASSVSYTHLTLPTSDLV